MSDTLAKALLAVQRDLPAIEPDALNPHFKNSYVSLDRLLAVVLPLLHKNGLVLTQLPSFGPNAEPALTTTLVHAESGERLSEQMPLILEKQNSQGQGSAITYGRRYMLAAMLGVSGERDDDGNAASQPQPKRQKATERPQEPRSRPAVPRGDKMRARIQELAQEADKTREADLGTTWDELCRVIAWRHDDPASAGDGYGDSWDSLSEAGLKWLGGELAAYLAAGATGITFYEHVSLPF